MQQGLNLEIIYGLFTIFLAVFSFIYLLLKNQNNREFFATWLAGSSAWLGYQQAIEKLLSGSEQLFGKSLFGVRALNRCFLFACLYPFLFFMLAWALGGSGQFGTVTIFEDSLTVNDRFIVLAVFVLIPFILYRRFADRLKWPRPARTNTRWSLPITNIQRDLHQEVDLVPAFGFMGFILMGSIAGVGAGVGASIVPIVIAVVSAGFVTGAMSVITMVTITTIYSVLFLAQWNKAIIFLLFFLVLPIANSLVDWLSYAASRFFMHTTMNNKTLEKSRVFYYLALNILTSLGFLILLIILLPFILKVLNNSISVIAVYFGADVDFVIDWLPLLAAAKANPFTQGLAITGMLLTPLIPIILHLSIGAVTVVQPVVFNGWRKHSMENCQLTDDLFSNRKNALTSLYLSIIFLLGLGFVVACLFSLTICIYYVSGINIFAVIGNCLYELAIWSNNLAGDLALFSYEGKTS